ncbi:EamA family transporter [Caloramator proteoclasticus]|uniref:EamA-like transporter family protein n=1 Tax=Caloramator proteoclasticus DSM 10124 TaxID=1121262 RepID=A0A1M5AD36_9CLOT|nr:EamA family transporter [Caloramator proteoclasticus]SHF28169.1 EamA-like transporter family protein [Caloramator proteoclasticus DSM 10124]
MSLKTFFILISMTLCGSLGGYFLKRASYNLNSLKTLILNKYIYIGGLFYCLGAILNIVLLKYIPYSLVLPLNSITYIWALLLAYFLLGEKIGRYKLFGILCIVVGVFFLTI